MLRQFPPENATKIDLVKFQLDSDALLKSVSSTPASSLISSVKSKIPYDKKSLGKLTNLADEISSAITDLTTDVVDVVPDAVKDADEQIADIKKSINSGDTGDSDFILALIFKIVPIGINIARRGKTIAQGFKEAAMGIVNTIKNLAILTAVTGIDTIRYFGELFIYAFQMLTCSVKIIINFPKCVIFYFVDIIFFFLLMCVLSVIFILDVFLQIKYFTGTSLMEQFMQLLEMLEALDRWIYSNFSFHIIHYPDSIINMCYKCGGMDGSGYKNAASRLFNDLFVRIPNEIGGPIGEFFTGVGHIFSFFDLS